jgi:hypothetical protein
MNRKWFTAIAVLSISALAAACGGGGGGGGAVAVPLKPPAFTNLAGTSWSVTDTVSSSNNSCGAPAGEQDNWTGVIATQSGNDLTVYDTRAGAGKAISGTISVYVVSFHGSRYPIGGCTSMTGSYKLTIDGTGTAFSGTATLTCLDNGCTVPVSVSGTKN